MKTRKIPRLLTLLTCLCFMSSVAPIAAANPDYWRDIRVGTASSTGVYHAVGNGVCKMVNRSRSRHGIFCVVEKSNGTVENLEAMRAGEFQFGVVQSDWQRSAYYGQGRFRPYGSFNNLRTVFAAHAESFTLLARPGSGIKSFADLRGKRVNVGVPGSGRRATMEVLMRAFGMSMRDFARAEEIQNGDRIAKALCDGYLDAAVYSIGHPNEEVDAAVSRCGAILTDVSGPQVRRMLAGHSEYRRVLIPGGTYPGNWRDTETFGTTAVFSTSADASDYVVYEITRAVFDNLQQFRKLHPAFKNLRPQEMASFNGGAPLHPGAERFFAERGY